MKYKTQTNEFTFKFKDDDIIIRAKHPTKVMAMDARFFFDILNELMPVKHSDCGMKRRAFQLRGHSLKDAIKKSEL